MPKIRSKYNYSPIGITLYDIDIGKKKKSKKKKSKKKNKSKDSKKVRSYKIIKFSSLLKK